jgi:hypothetical protein
MALSPKRKGDLAELHVASILLSDPALEVFVAACDDGHGSDIAVRSTRTGRWYSVQVKATGRTANPFVYLSRFRDAEDFVVAAVVLDERGLPERTFLVASRAWATDLSGCIARNDDGGNAGPYVEVRTTSAKHAGALSAYAPERVLGSL